MKSLRADCESGSPGCNVCLDLCEVYKAYLEVRARQGSRAGAQVEQAGLFEVSKVSTEGIERQKARWASSSNPGAKAIGAPPAPGFMPTPAPAREAIHALTDEEIRERILGLAPAYRGWLEIAGPVLTREELERFLQMSPAEKDKFIREFWKKRK
jgi:hypothetical protein